MRVDGQKTGRYCWRTRASAEYREAKLMKYDVVIVGGGAAGCVLAGRLAANGQTSVLLLEAGPDYPDPDNLPADIKFGHTRFAEAQASKHNWALHGTITEEQGEIHVAQGKVIGGGSSINGQAMQRGFPEDFDSWAALGNAIFRTIIAMARTDRSVGSLACHPAGFSCG